MSESDAGVVADPLEANITIGPVNLYDRTVSLDAGLQIAFPMPDQDEHLPDQIEAYVHQAGLQLQCRLFMKSYNP